MRKIALLFTFALITTLVFAEESKKPTICLNMIVKNESQVITRCLKSILPLIDYWVIVDTGSEDGTQGIIKDYMKDIPGELHERSWVNFGHNRNEALSLAQDKADYILFMDADDYLKYSVDYKMPYLKDDAYAFIAYNKELKCFWPRMIKSSLDWEWEGAIHEHITSKQSVKCTLLEDIEYMYVHDGARAKDPSTYNKDLALLKDALLKDPKNARNVFYLAMTHLRLGDLEKGLEAHQKRSQMKGHEEETFISYLSVPILQTVLKKDSNLINENFLKAYAFRPSRAETLYYLIDKLEQEKEYEKAYQVASLSHSLPFCSDNGLFVEQWIYDFGLQMRFAFCAEKTHRYVEAKRLCQNLLDKNDLPEHLRLEISACSERLNQEIKTFIQEKIKASVLN